jgi:hypothetical protein
MQSPTYLQCYKTKLSQQFTLALNITETFLCLHRPYFVRALHERVDDPVRSALAQSYLTVVERCNVSTFAAC